MNRRELLGAAAAAGAIAAAARAGAGTAAADLRNAARDAWIYGLPLIEMAGARTRTLAGRGGQPASLNRFSHARQLATDTSRAITAPNNDTLYSSAWMDLTKGPLTLTVPETGARYISIPG